MAGPIPISELMKTAQDPTLEVQDRVHAMRELGQRGPAAREAIPVLVALLDDTHSDIREAVFATLEDLGPAAQDAVPALIKMVHHPLEAPSHYKENGLRVAAARALGKIGPVSPDVVRTLIGALKDRDEDMPKYAALALGDIGPAASPAVPSLIKLFRKGNRQAKTAAAAALKRINTPEAQKALESK